MKGYGFEGRPLRRGSRGSKRSGSVPWAALRSSSNERIRAATSPGPGDRSGAARRLGAPSPGTAAGRRTLPSKTLRDPGRASALTTGGSLRTTLETDKHFETPSGMVLTYGRPRGEERGCGCEPAGLADQMTWPQVRRPCGHVRKAVLKLHGAMIRAAERWQDLSVADLERCPAKPTGPARNRASGQDRPPSGCTPVQSRQDSSAFRGPVK